MPELPEVEVLVRYLDPILRGKVIRGVKVHRAKIIRPTVMGTFSKRLTGSKILGVRRRAKYLLFNLSKGDSKPYTLLGHLGMTGRMYVQRAGQCLPKHAAISFRLNRGQFVFEDTRYFGRMTLAADVIDKLGPEPLSEGFNGEVLFEALSNCRQAIKPKLLDQTLLAGVGNIYASEALWHARISPRKIARRLTRAHCEALAVSVVKVLTEAINQGSTIPLDFPGEKDGDGLFYYGSNDPQQGYEERLMVYDREGGPCERCGASIRKIVQAARSTYFCPKCQRG